MDLQQAYKQLPWAPSHKALGIIAVKNPNGDKTLYKARLLMFGQAAAVYGFLTFSRAIVALGTSLLSLVLVEFFDDFTQIEPARSSDSAQQSMEGLLDLLGWKLRTSDNKTNETIFLHLHVVEVSGKLFGDERQCSPT